MIRFLNRSLLSFLVGILSGLTALLFLSIVQSILPSFSTEDLISRFFINEIGEELIKLLFIVFVCNLLFLKEENQFWVLVYSVFIGIGFGFFETILITLSKESWSLSGILMIMAVHLITSLILGIAIVFWKLKRYWFLSPIIIAIAFYLHIAYNLFALNFN